MLAKACKGSLDKWYWFLPFVLWADRITIKHGLGCSSFYAATGCHPLIPLDIEEATWLVELSDKILSSAEVIGYCTRALSKHHQYILDMCKHIDRQKREWV